MLLLMYMLLMIVFCPISIALAILLCDYGLLNTEAADPNELLRSMALGEYSLFCTHCGAIYLSVLGLMTLGSGLTLFTGFSTYLPYCYCYRYKLFCKSNFFKLMESLN